MKKKVLKKSKPKRQVKKGKSSFSCVSRPSSWPQQTPEELPKR